MDTRYDYSFNTRDEDALLMRIRYYSIPASPVNDKGDLALVLECRLESIWYVDSASMPVPPLSVFFQAGYRLCWSALSVVQESY